MIKCYDFFNCKNLDCVRRKTEDLQCWEIQNTLCNTQNDSAEQLQAAMENNKSFCELCPYYKGLEKHESISKHFKDSKLKTPTFTPTTNKSYW